MKRLFEIRGLATSATRNVLLACVACTALLGCDSTQPSEHEPEPVVEAYLIAGELLPPVWISSTEDIDAAFDPADLAIDGANVRIDLLSADAQTVERSWNYAPSDTIAGRYDPIDPLQVLAGRDYRLVADVPGFELVTASTRVPGDFELLSVSPPEIDYLDPRQVTFNVTRSDYPGRQTVFLFSLVAEQPTIENLTPIYLEFIYEIEPGEEYDPADLDQSELDDLLVNTSPPINEGNYQTESDGTLSVALPWFAVAFYGRTETIMYAMDENVYDFIRYQQVQQGGSTLGAGEIPNVRDHVSGGRGVFGSLASVSATIDVRRR